MNELPFELVDKIFSYLDGLSLAKSKEVCRKWRDLHNQHNYNLLWRKACLIEVPVDVLREITGYTNTKENFLEHLEQKETEMTWWKEVYKEWYRSRFIGKWPTMCLELKGHLSGPVYDAKISGDRVVTCGEDCTIRIWDAWTGCCLKTFQGHQNRVVCLAIRRKPGVSLHHDQPHDLIVSGSEDCSVCIWHMDDPGVHVKRLHHTSPVNCVAVQKNIVVAASTDATAVWDIELDDSEMLFRINSIDWVRYVGFLNNAVLTLTEKSILDLWSLSTGESLLSEVDFNHQEGICQAASRGDTLLALSHCGKLAAWQHGCGVQNDLGTGVLRNYKIIGPGAAGVQRGKCLAFSGCLVAIVTEMGPIYVYHLERNWDKQFQKIHAIIQSDDTPPNSVALGDDGTGPMLLTAGNDGIARVHRWFPFSATDVADHVTTAEALTKQLLEELQYVLDQPIVNRDENKSNVVQGQDQFNIKSKQ